MLTAIPVLVILWSLWDAARAASHDMARALTDVLIAVLMAAVLATTVPTP